MKCYCAGPMRGYPQSNFAAFDSASNWLRAQGHVVFNPADHDRETGYLGEGDLTQEQFYAMFRWDLGKVAESDFVVFLPGWQRSKGACVERAVAFYLGLKCYDLRDLGEGCWGMSLQAPMQEPLIPWMPKSSNTTLGYPGMGLADNGNTTPPPMRQSDR